MKLIKPFAVYRCTQCDEFHISDLDFDSLFQPHSQYQDANGIVTRYQLNDTIDTVISAATALFTVGWLAAGVFRAVSAWPNKPEWSVPFGVTAGLWFSVIWLIFMHDQTFGPRPWQKEQRLREKVKGLWDSAVVAGLTFIGAGLLLWELVSRGRPRTLLDLVLWSGCIILAEAFVLMKVFAKRIPHSEIQERSWGSLLFWVWAFIAFGLWAGPPKEPWGKIRLESAAADALVIVLAFAVFSLALVGIIKGTKFCADWIFVQLVRSWRRAERTVEKKESNKSTP